jgi:hypothetical protein
MVDPVYPSTCVIFETTKQMLMKFGVLGLQCDRLCGLVARVLGYKSGGPGSIPGTTRFSGGGGAHSGSGTGSTQPREHN